MKLGRNFHKALVASGFANLADGVFQVALPCWPSSSPGRRY